MLDSRTKKYKTMDEASKGTQKLIRKLGKVKIKSSDDLDSSSKPSDDWATITSIVTGLSDGTIDFVRFKEDLLQDILENFAGKEALLRCLSRLRAIEHVLPTPELKGQLKPNFAKLVYLILSAASNSNVATSKNIQNIRRYEREFNSYLIKILSDVDAELTPGCETKEQYETLLLHYQNLASLLDPAEPVAFTTEQDIELGKKISLTRTLYPVTKKTAEQKKFIEEKDGSTIPQTDAINLATSKFKELLLDDTRCLQGNNIDILPTVQNAFVVKSEITIDEKTNTAWYAHTESPVYVDKVPSEKIRQEQALQNVLQISNTAKEVTANKFSSAHLTYLETDTSLEENQIVIAVLDGIKKSKPTIDRSCSPKLPRSGTKNLATVVGFNQDIQTKKYPQLEKAQKISSIISRQESTLEIIFSQNDPVKTVTSCKGSEAVMHERVLKGLKKTAEEIAQVEELIKNAEGRKIPSVNSNNLISSLPNQQNDHVLFSKQLTAANFNTLFSNEIIRETLNGIYNYERDDGSNGKRGLIRARFYREALESDQYTELQKYIVILALLSSSDGERLKKSVKKTLGYHGVNRYSLITKITTESSIGTNILNIITGELIATANLNKEEQFKKMVEVSGDVLKNCTISKKIKTPLPSSDQTEGNLVSGQKDGANSGAEYHEFVCSAAPIDRNTYQQNILNLLRTLDIKQFQSHAKHDVLPEIKKTAKSSKQLDKDKWKAMQSKCRDNTTGLKNWYAKSSLSFFSKGRHDTVDFIYRAVSEENNVHSRMIDKFEDLEEQRIKLEKVIQMHNFRGINCSLFQKSVKSYYKNIRYAAEKNPEDNEFEVDEKKLCKLQLERKIVKLLQSEIDRLQPDIADSHIKVLAYKALITQIQQSGVASLYFDRKLKLAWKGGEKIKIPGEETVIKQKDDEITIEDALCWNRGFFGIKTTSATVYQEILDLKKDYKNIPVAADAASDDHEFHK